MWDRIQPTAVRTGFTHGVESDAVLRTGEGVPLLLVTRVQWAAPDRSVMLTADILELHKDELVSM